MNIDALLERTKHWSTNPGLVLMDIDGCCIDSDERWSMFSDKKVEYDEYKTLHHIDKPILAGCVIYSLLLNHSKLACVFLTSRSEDQRQQTEEQLRILFGYDASFQLWMKPVGNADPCMEYKLWMLQSKGYEPHHVVLAFDDRPSVVEAYRAVGITAYQTAVGY